MSCYIEEIISEDLQLLDIYSRVSADDLLIKKSIIDSLNDGLYNTDISQFALDFFN